MKQMATMTHDEKSFMLTLCENHVSLKWKKLWSGPKLALDYIKAVTIRGFAAERRLNEFVGDRFCKEIDFATIFNVDAFLAALKLTNAREMSESTCDLELNVKSDKEEKSNENQINVRIKPLMVSYSERNHLIITHVHYIFLGFIHRLTVQLLNNTNYQQLKKAHH